jgi:broad-specificity NMP kinase
VITAVLGAPGSGKSTIAPLLRDLLPSYVIVDWDDFMTPAAALAGRDIRTHPETWPAYRQLVRSVLDSLPNQRVVLIGVGTPDELVGWPIGAWLVLDCSDRERCRRLTQAGRSADAPHAIADAAEYRSLGLPVLDTSAEAPLDVATEVARRLAQPNSS